MHTQKRKFLFYFWWEEKSINRPVKNEVASQKFLFLLFIAWTKVFFFFCFCFYEMMKLHLEQILKQSWLPPENVSLILFLTMQHLTENEAETPRPPCPAHTAPELKVPPCLFSDEKPRWINVRKCESSSPETCWVTLRSRVWWAPVILNVTKIKGEQKLFVWVHWLNPNEDRAKTLF